MFIVKEVFIKGCIYLGNSGITSLHYTPNERLQFIIGSNGSGKSTLIRMLIPHVPKSTIFTEDGEYKLVVDIDGTEYCLHYKLSPKSFFSFTIDGGRNLNDGGTGSVQKKLIETYIKLDQEVINILLGVERFTTMTPSRRKYWMSRLSPTSVDFIIDAYTKVNEKVRATTSNIQFLQRKILTATETLNGLGDGSEAKDRHRLYTEILDEIFPLKTKVPNVKSLDDMMGEVGNFTDKFIAAIKKVPERITVNGIEISISDKDAISEAYRWASSQYEAVKQTYLNKANELTHIEEHTAIIDKLGSEEKIQEELDLVRKDYNKLVAEFEECYPGKLESFTNVDVETILDTLTAHNKALISDIIAICNRLKPDPNKIYTRDSLASKQEYHTKLLSDKSLLVSEIAKANNLIIGCDNAEHIHCSRCGNKWKHGYSEEEVAIAREQVEYKANHLEIIKDLIDASNDWLELCRSWLEGYSTLHGIANKYPVLMDIMSVILSDRIIRENPNLAYTEILAYVEQLEKVSAINAAKKSISIQEDKLRSIINAKQYGGENLLRRKDLLSEELRQADSDRVYYDGLVATIKSFINSSNLYHECITRLTIMDNELGQYEQLYMEKVNAQVIDFMISELQISLGKVNEELGKRNSLLRTINDLETSMAEEKKDLENYKLLAEGLSPTAGLLAEQLSVSINVIVDGINSVISSLWKSDLYIMPCGIEEGELNYQFPFNSTNSKDVSEGSLGQKDIVDLAFKIMVYHLLNLNQYPLFLDELGCFFDRAHKTTLTKYISESIENGVFSQVFYISHAVEQYLSAGASDINVLCDRNITLPAVYNTNLKLL